MAYAPASLILLLLLPLLFWTYARLYPVVSPISIPLSRPSLSRRLSRLYPVVSPISIPSSRLPHLYPVGFSSDSTLSFSWRSPASISNHSFLLLEDRTSPSLSTTSVCILLHSPMWKFSVFHVMSSSILPLLSMMTVLYLFSLFHIGVNISCFRFFFVSCVFTSSLNFDWQTPIIYKLLRHLNLSILLISLKSLVFPWSPSAVISIFYAPLRSLNNFVTGNRQTYHLIFSFTSVVHPCLYSATLLFVTTYRTPFLVYLLTLPAPLDLRVLQIGAPSSLKVIPFNQSLDRNSLNLHLRFFPHCRFLLHLRFLL